MKTMMKISILFLALLFQSCDELEYKRGDKLCVLNKEVEIRTADRINQRYECWYVDNNGIIQEIIVLRKEAKPKCNEKSN